MSKVNAFDPCTSDYWGVVAASGSLRVVVHANATAYLIQRRGAGSRWNTENSVPRGSLLAMALPYDDAFASAVARLIPDDPKDVSELIRCRKLPIRSSRIKRFYRELAVGGAGGGVG